MYVRRARTRAGGLAVDESPRDCAKHVCQWHRKPRWRNVLPLVQVEHPVRHCEEGEDELQRRGRPEERLGDLAPLAVVTLVEHDARAEHEEAHRRERKRGAAHRACDFLEHLARVQHNARNLYACNGHEDIRAELPSCD
jgi:hypothetical protein